MNTTSTKLALILTLAFCSAATVYGKDKAKEKDRDWQTGKVLDSDRVGKYVGSTGYSVGHSVNSSAVYRTEQTYTIQLGEYVYVAQERLRRKSKPAYLTVNGSVKVAIEKHTLYLIDDDGKEHEAAITKKILQEKPPQ